MMSDELFQRILISPSIDLHADALEIVSGYATAHMAIQHIKCLQEKRTDIFIRLTVGMVPREGILQGQHQLFRKIQQKAENRFVCGYVVQAPAVHAKVYVWTRENQPIKAFVGSANYTHQGFGKAQKEVVTESDAAEAFAWCREISHTAVECVSEDIENYICIHSLKKEESDLADLECVDLPLVPRNSGAIQEHAGLNWGQREGRDHDQAYIPVPAAVGRSDFFPPTAEHFTVLTDDDKSMICVIAQQNRKAIHTTHDNSELGRYFRNRLKLQPGEFVKLEQLKHYGRISVTFRKIDPETYYMDFSPNLGPSEK